MPARGRPEARRFAAQSVRAGIAAAVRATDERDNADGHHGSAKYKTIRPGAEDEMEITDILDRDAVIPSLKVTSKRQVLEDLSARAAEATGLSKMEIFDVLQERERLGTTGVGGGVAVPHGKLARLDRLYACFARLDAPVDFESVDDESVDLVFLLLAPETAAADHLKVLRRISRLLRDRSTCDALRSAPTQEVVLNLLAGHAHPKAA